MHRRYKWGIALTGALMFLAASVALFDWNLLKRHVEQRVEAATGRELRIAGDLDVDLGWHPRIRMEQVSFANTEWGSAPIMFRADALEFSVAIREWLRGRLRVPEVRLSRPSILLEAHPDGRANWVLEKSQRDRQKAPHIDMLTVDDGHVRYRAQKIGTDIVASVTTLPGTGQENELVTAVAAEGRYFNTPLRFQGRGGSILRLEDQSVPFPLDMTFTTPDAQASLKGAITALAKMGAADLRFEMNGQDLSSLSSLIRLNLPQTPAYAASGRLLRTDKTWAFHDLKARIGNNDAAGFFSITTGKPRPYVRADLISNHLDLTAFQRPAKNTRTQRPLVLERLRTLDADVRLDAADVDWRKLPFGRVQLQARLRDGQLTLDQMRIGFAGGHATGSAFVDAKAKSPSSMLDMKFHRLQLEQLLPRLNNGGRAGFGTLGGRAELKASGGTLQEILSRLNGKAGFAMSGGHISNLSLELVGLDAGESLRFLIGGDRQVPIRCGVADVDVRQGKATSRTFVLDTADTVILGDGTIDLPARTIDFTLRPRPKDMSLLSARSPIHLTGKLSKPSIRPDAGALAAKGAAALLLGAVALPATIIPLIETGPGRDSDCRALINQVGKR